MPAFDVVVVGCGGGPSETNLSAYLLKPYDAAWLDGTVALEAGSGLGTLSYVMALNPNLFDDEDAQSTCGLSAYDVYSSIRCFLITHAHLDHINGLVLSAGTLKGPRKRIHAARHVIDNIETVFSDRVWPKLASWSAKDDDYKLMYDPLKFTKSYRTISPNVSVRMTAVTHGHNDTTGVYESTAFFLRHDPSGQELLFFGDVEPDSVASRPLTLATWRAAAPMIPETLGAIFIECSWPLGRREDLLYGHLSPEHLTDELAALATEVKPRPSPVDPELLRDALKGLRVYITHCKDDLEGRYDRPIRHVIADQVRELVEKKRLGAEILSVEQGSRIGLCYSELGLSSR
ncbi:cyclic-AMP phosphodiesterase-like protein [Heterobasidion irregulare TC 32-1]|uniref:Cyclic-AMP phosphodiesterase-like protein n=1 Tax=Heterobasidion irregulare (strain TC 32-1) TaxID=747525 RepID=W4KKR1_HETIT|nr:cyclic-AMP phosphodiesterase-like protein [Heterobasidion irregulare TC 32-1]ETW85656.1 cyclic-AMP phosphodiesterase-like protein [Heterobasidion irregulare TC 32-1]